MRPASQHRNDGQKADCDQRPANHCWTQLDLRETWHLPFNPLTERIVILSALRGNARRGEQLANCVPSRDFYSRAIYLKRCRIYLSINFYMDLCESPRFGFGGRVRHRSSADSELITRRRVVELLLLSSDCEITCAESRSSRAWDDRPWMSSDSDFQVFSCNYFRVCYK